MVPETCGRLSFTGVSPCPSSGAAAPPQPAKSVPAGAPEPPRTAAGGGEVHNGLPLPRYAAGRTAATQNGPGRGSQQGPHSGAVRPPGKPLTLAARLGFPGVSPGRLRHPVIPGGRPDRAPPVVNRFGSEAQHPTAPAPAPVDQHPEPVARLAATQPATRDHRPAHDPPSRRACRFRAASPDTPSSPPMSSHETSSARSSSTRPTSRKSRRPRTRPNATSA